MHPQIMTFYSACDAYLQHKGFRDGLQAHMSTVEGLLIALVAAFLFCQQPATGPTSPLGERSGSQDALRKPLQPPCPSPLRGVDAWHKIATDDWQGILTFLIEQYLHDTYIVESCPFPVCHNRRASRSRLYQDEGNAYWGSCVVKEEYYDGLKAHVIVTASGRPVEVLLLSGCRVDLTGLKEMLLNLPPGAHLYVDKAYTDYIYEESLLADKQLTFLPIRKSIHKRQYATEVVTRVSKGRKRIETTFS